MSTMFDHDRDFFLNRYKDIVRTEDGYRLQKTWEEGEGGKPQRTSEHKNNPTQNEFTKNCDICIHFIEIGDTNKCAIRTALENCPANSFIPIRQQISDIMEKQGFKAKDRYGNYSSAVTFEDYVKRELNVDASVQKALDQFMKKVRDDVSNNITKMFDQTTQAALSSVVMNMLSNSNAFMEMRDNLKRITDGN